MIIGFLVALVIVGGGSYWVGEQQGQTAGMMHEQMMTNDASSTDAMASSSSHDMMEGSSTDDMMASSSHDMMGSSTGSDMHGSMGAH